MGKLFSKRVENFLCEHCGASVEGDGYTNHCPKCLFSKHVDVHPGDRAASCLGLMEPIGIVVSGSSYIIRFKCTKCGHTINNKVAKDDDIEKIIELSVVRRR